MRTLVLTRLLPVALAALLAAPSLSAQFDPSTMAGRIITRRMEALEQDPAVKELDEAGTFDFDVWRIEVMDDPTLIELVRLMALGIQREEKRSCPAAVATGDGNEIMEMMLNGITDSLEAEAWAEVIEQAIWSMASNKEEGPVAPPEELQEHMASMVDQLTEKEQETMNNASADPGAAACMLMRVMFTDLARADSSKAGPLIRGLMSVGLGQQNAEDPEEEQ